MSSCSILQHSFRTCEGFSQAINTRRQVTIRQLSLDPFQCGLLLIESDQIQFSFVTELSGPIRVIGPKGGGYLEFCFALQSGKQELFSHQMVIPQNTLFGFDPTREVNLIVPPYSILCIVQVKQVEFEDYARSMERNDLDISFLKQNYIAAPEAMMDVQTYLQELYYLATRQSAFLSYSDSSHILFEDFLPLMIDSIPYVPTRLGKSLSTPRRFDLVKRAEDYMQANLKQSITLMDICQALHTSDRPLNYGFKQVFGSSPMAYLKAIRLQAVRKQLQTADPSTTIIADVATQFGFWSLGHFSRDYKKMFGELPSETLKRRLNSHN